MRGDGAAVSIPLGDGLIPVTRALTLPHVQPASSSAETAKGVVEVADSGWSPPHPIISYVDFGLTIIGLAITIFTANAVKDIRAKYVTKARRIDLIKELNAASKRLGAFIKPDVQVDQLSAIKEIRICEQTLTALSLHCSDALKASVEKTIEVCKTAYGSSEVTRAHFEAITIELALVLNQNEITAKEEDWRR